MQAAFACNRDSQHTSMFFSVSLLCPLHAPKPASTFQRGDVHLQGYSALHYAAAEGHTEAIALLLSHAADPNAATEVRMQDDGYDDANIRSALVGNTVAAASDTCISDLT